MQEHGPRAYIAEFFGTFVLVAIIAMVVILFNGVPALIGFLIIGLAQAFIFAMLIHTVGGVSGGYFNPAITFGLTLIRKLKVRDAIFYWIVQLAGGVCGVLFAKAILTDEGESLKYAALTVNPNFINDMQGLLVEGAFTFLLVWAVVGLASNAKSYRESSAWIIGMTLGALVIIAAPLTGAGLNPARWLGSAVVGGEWKDWWLYVVGPLVGGGLAAVLYQVVFAGAATGSGAVVEEKVGVPARSGLDVADIEDAGADSSTADSDGDADDSGDGDEKA